MQFGYFSFLLFLIGTQKIKVHIYKLLTHLSETHKCLSQIISYKGEKTKKGRMSDTEGKDKCAFNKKKNSYQHILKKKSFQIALNLSKQLQL